MITGRLSAGQGLLESLGPIAALLEDDSVTDLHRNPDGHIRLVRYGHAPESAGLQLDDTATHSIIRLAADFAGTVVTAEHPLVAATLPDGSRFQGVVPPIAAAPTFSIRRHRAGSLTLDDYQRLAILTAAQTQRLRAAVEDHANILVTGRTGVGKTTLLNAMLAEPGVAAGRLFIAEDTREIQASGADVVQLRTCDTVSLRDLVSVALRMRPERIIVGETRTGAAAIEMLKAWTTSHRGGFSTLHADGADGFVPRLRGLLREVVGGGIDPLIGHAIDLVVHLDATRDGPRCTGIASVRCRGVRLEVEVAPRDEPPDASGDASGRARGGASGDASGGAFGALPLASPGHLPRQPDLQETP